MSVRRKKARPARSPRSQARPPLDHARVVFWPFGLHGNPGAELGVENLFDSFSSAQGEALDDARSRLHAIAGRTEVEMIDYAEPQELLRWRAELRARFDEATADGALPVFVGGNHLVLLPILEAHAARRGTRTLVVSFDAHLDAYDHPSGRERLHHGNFLTHFARPPHVTLVSLGDRDHVLSRATAAKHLDRVIGMDAIAGRPLEATISELRALAARADAVHLDVDLDVLDPSALRAVGTPMPCGLGTRELCALMEPLLTEKLAGVSFSEYNAGADQDGTGRQLVSWLLEHVLLKRFEG